MILSKSKCYKNQLSTWALWNVKEVYQADVQKAKESLECHPSGTSVGMNNANEWMWYVHSYTQKFTGEGRKCLCRLHGIFRRCWPGAVTSIVICLSNYWLACTPMVANGNSQKNHPHWHSHSHSTNFGSWNSHSEQLRHITTAQLLSVQQNKFEFKCEFY